MIVYVVTVKLEEDWKEPFVFSDFEDAYNFVVHLRDSYDLSIGVGDILSREITTYDNAIQKVVEWLDPSED